MFGRKRKTLPKDFKEMLESASLDDLKAVFKRCALNATGGYGKQTAISFVQCPDELLRWLVEQGLDVNASDQYGCSALHERALVGWDKQIPLLVSLGAAVDGRDNSGCTPLHMAAGNQKPATVRALLAQGADVNAQSNDGDTPLMRGLCRTRGADIEGMAQVAEMLIEAGARSTPDMRQEVERIGKDFEFHRESFSPDYLEATDAGLNTLYRLFGAQAAPARQMHDGVSPIQMPAGDWPAQHQALWELLVPSSGAAATVQGEVIRLSGRLSREILDNGGCNWDKDFRAMLAALAAHFGAGTPLSEAELREAQDLAQALRGGDGDDDQLYRLCELAVVWVAANPNPMPLPAPAYAR